MKRLALAIFVCAFAVSAIAQTNVTTSGGTAGVIPVWIGTTDIENTSGARTGKIGGMLYPTGPTPWVLALSGAAGRNALAPQSPVPLVNEPLVPASALPGAVGFTLTVNGTGFVSGSVVNWNGAPLVTTFVTSSQLTAAVPAADLTTPGTALVTVFNPAPGGGTSNPAAFEVTYPTSTVFFSEPGLPTGTFPWGSVTADFNGDGKPDLAVANFGFGSGTTVSILLGNGDGTFQSQTTYAVGLAPFQLATGDFNNDGKPDLAVGNMDDNTVSILLGKGDGTFQPQMTYPTGTSPNSVTIGDFNGDGKLDLAVVNMNDNTVSIFLGNGDGTFQSQVAYGTGNFPVSVATGDFNGDGKLDLAVVNEADSTVSILVGNGDGTFGPGTPFAVGALPRSLGVGDFNGDAKLDLATANIPNSTTGTVSILLGNGDGTFHPHVDYTSGAEPDSIVAADLNGDGRLDLALVDEPGISILLGNGDGTFQPHTDISTSCPQSITSADFNLDGKLDLGVVQECSSSVAVLLQTAAVLSPAIVNFAPQPLGTTSTPQTVTLSNNGTASFTLSGFSFGGADPSDFAETNTCGASLAPNASCSISITFTPGVVGTLTASLNVSDSAVGSPQSVSLSGTGAQAQVEFFPSALTFPPQLIGVRSPAMSLTLQNVGQATLTITNIAVNSPGFAETNNCPASLAPGGTCTLRVTFDPFHRGLLTGAISVTDNAPGSPQQATLTGTGTSVTVSPSSLNFGSVMVNTTSPPQTVTFTNHGFGSLTLSGIKIRKGDISDFAETNNCPATLAVGASCTVSVTFTPRNVGVRSANLEFADDGGASPQIVPLTGTGT